MTFTCGYYCYITTDTVVFVVIDILVVAVLPMSDRRFHFPATNQVMNLYTSQ